MRLRVLAAAALMLASASASAAPVLVSGLGPTSPLGVALAPVGRVVSLVTGLVVGGSQLLVVPALPAVHLPGLVPLPAVPIPVTSMLAGLDAIPTTVKLLEGIAPLAVAVPIPVVTPIFLNF